MDDAERDQDLDEGEEANSPAVTSSLAALAVLLLAVVLGVLVMLVRG